MRPPPPTRRSRPGCTGGCTTGSGSTCRCRSPWSVCWPPTSTPPCGTSEPPSRRAWPCRARASRSRPGSTGATSTVGVRSPGSGGAVGGGRGPRGRAAAARHRLGRLDRRPARPLAAAASRGPLTSPHAAWDNRCDACHTPFEPINGDRWPARLFGGGRRSPIGGPSGARAATPDRRTTPAKAGVGGRLRRLPPRPPRPGRLPGSARRRDLRPVPRRPRPHHPTRPRSGSRGRLPGSPSPTPTPSSGTSRPRPTTPGR